MGLLRLRAYCSSLAASQRLDVHLPELIQAHGPQLPGRGAGGWVAVPPTPETAVPAAPAHLPPGGGRRLHGRVVLGQVPGHCSHEPLEVFAPALPAQLLLGRDVPRGQVPVLGAPPVDVLCELVHPGLGHALQVLCSRREGYLVTWALEG